LYVDVVNSIDIWLKDSEHFELGKVFMRLVAGSREVNRMLFSKENSNYIFHLLSRGMEYLQKDDANISLDDNVHSIKKSFFINGANNTLENIVSNFVVEELSNKSDELMVHYGE